MSENSEDTRDERRPRRGGGGNGGGGGKRFFSRPRVCQFCADKTVVIDYKNTGLLRTFVTREGKIRPRRQTGTCARHQRAVARAVKRARHLALLSYTGESLS